MSTEREFEAFRAGFDLGAERAYVWVADDEWVRCYFNRWAENTELPEVCNVREDPHEESWAKSPPCLRPAGHRGKHDWDARK
jgi:hypothetical protein